MKKSRASLLFLGLLLALCACESSQTPSKPADVPEENLNRYKYRILATSSRATDAIWSGGSSGAALNDAVFDKLCAVEARYNCSVILSTAPAAGDSGIISRSILAGQDDFDLCLTEESALAQMSLMGLFENLHDIPGMQLDKPYYITNGFSLGDQLYLFSGDISYYGLSETYMLYFNKCLFDDYSIPYPYDDVRAHTWTLQKLLSLVKNGYDDLNGNGKPDSAGDIFGYVSGGNYDAVAEGFGLEPFKETNGIVTYEPDEDAYEKVVFSMFTLSFDPSVWLADTAEDAMYLFRDGHSLFYYDKFFTAADSFASADKSTLTWGVVPMPLVDEKQADYYSVSRDYPAAIPRTAEKHLDTIGKITDALAEEGRELVYPVYYELGMKARYADTEAEAEMVDLIASKRKYSFSHLFGGGKDLNSILLPTLLDPADPKYSSSSFLASQAGKQAGLAVEIMTAFADLRGVPEADTAEP